MDNPNSCLVVSKNRVKKTAEVYTPLCGVNFIWRSVVYAHQKHFMSEEDFRANQKEFMRGKFCKLVNYFFMAYVDVYEPYCGSGNFLEIIYRDKLKFLFFDAKQNNIPLSALKDIRFFFCIINVISSVNAYDIIADNIAISRARCYLIINKVFKRVYGIYLPLSLGKIIAYLLKCKIIHTDTNAMEYIELHLTCDNDGNCSYFFSHEKEYKAIYDKKEYWQTNKRRDEVEFFKKSLFQMGEIFKHYKEVSATIDTSTTEQNIAKVCEYIENK